MSPCHGASWSPERGQRAADGVGTEAVLSQEAQVGGGRRLCPVPHQGSPELGARTRHARTSQEAAPERQMGLVWVEARGRAGWTHCGLSPEGQEGRRPRRPPPGTKVVGDAVSVAAAFATRWQEARRQASSGHLSCPPLAPACPPRAQSQGREGHSRRATCALPGLSPAHTAQWAASCRVPSRAAGPVPRHSPQQGRSWNTARTWPSKGPGGRSWETQVGS